MTTNRPRKPKRWELYKKEFQIPELRTDEPAGLYPRQSTKRQQRKNRQSFEKQTLDAIDDLMKRGWPRELIRVYDKDMGHSARAALEDREALNQMLDDVREKRIRTVRAAEVDRLFRDEDRIDSNLFIKICREADCLVLTDRMIYDFSIPRHVDYFRDEVDRAWKFYESQILIRANELQDRARSKGQFVGGALPIGYIVDKRPKSETFMKLIPYPLHAERTLEVFQWLYDCGGILGVLRNKLDSLPYVWPLEEEWVREQNAFQSNLEVAYGAELDEEGNLKPIGYRVSAHGLRLVLGNRVYRGDWPYNGDWIEHNHDPIVPKDLFDFAQEVLERNRQARATGAINYHTPTPSVIHDLLYAGPPEAHKRYIVLNRQEAQYSIEELRGMTRAVLAKIAMRDIEAVFLQKFTEQLRDTTRFENYEEKLDRSEETKRIEGRRKNLLETIAQVTERIDGIFLTLQSPSLQPHERGEFIKERRKLTQRRENLENELSIQSPTQVYLKYKDLIQLMGKYWDRYPFEDRQALVALLVRRVYLEPLSHYFMKMNIEWKEFPEDVGIISRRHPSSTHWVPEEDQILTEMYPTAATRDILQALPHRSWTSIQTRASKLDITRLVKKELVLSKYMSMEDLAVMERYDISKENLAEVLFTKWVCWCFPFMAASQVIHSCRASGMR
jgi:DNA invertase Pin-like site-specific DNA recombinase